jgi:flagellar basal-body rod protein FlgF
MIRGLYTSSSAMQVEIMRQDVIANNLANLNTSGFKKDFAVMEAKEKLKLWRTNNPSSKHPDCVKFRAPIGDLGTGVNLDRIYKNFEQGNLQHTANPLDLALHGDGYFVLKNADGTLRYTRAGDFTKDANGFLVDESGRRVQGDNGDIQLLEQGQFTISDDGRMVMNNQSLGKLQVVKFANPDNQLEKLEDTTFRMNNGVAAPIDQNTTISQGYREMSNVNSVTEMVNMIAALRQYEANQKAITSQDETLGKAVNDVGRYNG